jgi:hypothetical protein
MFYVQFLDFIDAFLNFPKATISFVTSIRPSVWPHKTQLPLNEFPRNLIFQYFSKICWENSSLIKIWISSSTLDPWTWDRQVVPKRRSLTNLRWVITQKTEEFIACLVYNTVSGGMSVHRIRLHQHVTSNVQVSFNKYPHLQPNITARDLGIILIATRWTK